MVQTLYRCSTATGGGRGQIAATCQFHLRTASLNTYSIPLTAGHKE